MKRSELLLKEEGRVRGRIETYIMHDRGNQYFITVEFNPDFDKMKPPQWMIEMLLDELAKMPEDPEEFERYVAQLEEEKNKPKPRRKRVRNSPVVQTET